MLADALAFFQAFDGMETGFRNRADEVIALLHGEDTRFVLVASPRVDTIDEARFFADRLVEKELGGRRDHRQPGDARLRRARRGSGPGSKSPTRPCTTTRRSSTSSPSANTRTIAPLVADTGQDPTWVPLLPGDVHDLEALDKIRTLLFAGSAAARRAGRVDAVHILVATDADYVLDDITAALGGPDVSFTVCRNGRDVSDVVEERTPDLVVLDLQIGSMGGMAVTMALRLDESSGRAAPREGADAARPRGRHPPGQAMRRRRLPGQAAESAEPEAARRRAILNPPAVAAVEPVAEETPEEEPAPVG